MMDEQRVNIRCPEALSISSSASARSTYGLVGGYAGRNPQRDHVVRKYTTRVKMLGTFAAMVLVIGGGAAYLGATHSSTEVVHIGKARETSAENEEHSNIFIVPSKPKESSHYSEAAALQASSHILKQPKPAVPMQESIVQSQLNEPISITKNQADHVNGKDSVESAKVVLSSSAANEKGESEMQSDEPSYNKLANCTNHVKRGPKNEAAVPEKYVPLEINPVGLLLEMLECPTFDYFRCDFDNKKGHGFKAFVHVRSMNDTKIGYGHKKISARRDAAYRAALVLYPTTSNNDSPLPPISAHMMHAHCEKV
ncbi:uncharacterized protein LOC110844036 [Folsomia candida]|uniref:uncharacterized protein LOC110844036 n=1 Tax=Folsomia candida TaxID=158441 RepID=UPI000B8FB00D|nr:uncharacterized protein LOC110844036 [Folsomia candida]